jgi:hypothetical protein
LRTYRLPRCGFASLAPHSAIVKEFNSETTLYGEELVVMVSDEKRSKTKAWREHVYTVEENRARYETQQRVWRRGRRQGTEDDLRAESLAQYTERRDRSRATR